MLMDNELLFSENQAITAEADSTNVIDMSFARDIGIGTPLYLFLLVTETFDDSGDDSTLAVTLVTDDNADLTSDATVRSLVTLPANAAAGTILYFRLEPNQLAAGNYQQYLGLHYTPANGNLSAGKVTAGIVLDVPKQTNYASGFRIS